MSLVTSLEVLAGQSSFVCCRLAALLQQLSCSADSACL